MKDKKLNKVVLYNKCDFCGDEVDVGEKTTNFWAPYKYVETEDCPRCQEIKKRAPEIFSWIIDVLKEKDDKLKSDFNDKLNIEIKDLEERLKE